jgi:hypothetical protein
MNTETVTWDQAKAGCEQLIAQALPFDRQMFEQFSSSKGVYAFVYTGNQLSGKRWGDPVPQIIYLGHTGPDSCRHWQDNTGISTIRRSLAAMLAHELDLKPIPRSENPQDEDRYANYKLDEASEAALTEWMQQHIEIAFLELPEKDIEPWFLALVNYSSPMFVFQHNPNNSFGAQIKQYRLRLAEMAANA